MSNFSIRPMMADDAAAVLSIYGEGIATRNATFETAVPDWETWATKHRPDCRFVAVDDEGVVGWAALSPTSARHVYRGVAEVSVYIGAIAQGMGVGKQLMAALVESSEAAGVWTLTASIFPENEASVGLHQRFGFHILGKRERIACLDGEWRSTVLLERRSDIVGMEGC